jgi:hypothetical protein
MVSLVMINIAQKGYDLLLADQKRVVAGVVVVKGNSRINIDRSMRF